MSNYQTTDQDSGPTGERWYDLFSRGGRDWLRHNEKVREAVRGSLPELVSGADVLSGDGSGTVRVPVRFLEHYRFQLRQTDEQQGVGQGKAKPGDVLSPERPDGEAGSREGSGHGEGGPVFVVELKVDDIVDWLWEELSLPNLQPKPGALEEDDYTREGWDKRGARARLDRRRTLKEAIKRRSVQAGGPAFSNEDLRYRQLVKRRQPFAQAVVLFALDASSSMRKEDRRLAKTFFFWALQGLRRQYRRIETAFVAHTVGAWEFSEDEFFQVTAQGGTVASVAFDKVREIIDQRYDPSRYNVYLFYASDGENFADDQDAATESLQGLAPVLSFAGYVETGQSGQPAFETETGAIMQRLYQQSGLRGGSYSLNTDDDVWGAIRAFFQEQTEAA